MLRPRHVSHAICILLLVLSGWGKPSSASKGNETNTSTSQPDKGFDKKTEVPTPNADDTTIQAPLTDERLNKTLEEEKTNMPGSLTDKSHQNTEGALLTDPNLNNTQNAIAGPNNTQVLLQPDLETVKVTSKVTKIEDLDFSKIVNKDGEISLLDAVSVKILVGESDALSVASLSIIRQPELINSSDLNVYSVDFHWNKMFVFYAVNNSIYRARLAGRAALEDETVIVNKGADGPVQLAVDWVQDNIYWISTTYQTVEVVDLEGKNRRIIFDAIGKFFYPNNIAVDPYTRTLFIVSHYTVFRCDLSKQDITPQLLTPVGNIPGQVDGGVRALALDRRNKHVYLAGVRMKEENTTDSTDYNLYLMRTTYDGKDVGSGDDVSTLFDDVKLKEWNDIYLMDVFMDTLYFAHYVQSNNTPDTIYEVPLTDKEFNATMLYVPKFVSDSIWAIRVIHPCVQRPADHPHCQRNKLQ